MENNPRFGEIIYANLPYCGSVQGGIRPVLVVQNDVGNRHAPTVEVIPLSSRLKMETMSLLSAITSPDLPLTVLIMVTV